MKNKAGSIPAKEANMIVEIFLNVIIIKFSQIIPPIPLGNSRQKNQNIYFSIISEGIFDCFVQF